MNSSWLGTARTLAFLAGLLGVRPLFAEVKTPESHDSPEALVRAALQSELNGPSAIRKELLTAALEIDPDYAPARWQMGYVRWENQWLTNEEVAKRVAGDKALAAYRKRRDALVDTADNQRALAQWCRKNKLTDLERIHWAKVLEFNANDAEALNALGLQLHNGRLLTRQQIEQEKVVARNRALALQQWRPKMLKWREAFDRGTDKQHDEAVRELSEIKDPEALQALDLVFGSKGDSQKVVELNRVVLEAAGRMQHPEATQLLLRYAVFSDSQGTRQAAANELKKRPMHTYVPWLIAALPGSVKTRFNVFVLPNGMVSHEHEIFLEGRKADVSFSFTSVVSPADAFAAMATTPRAANRELNRAAVIEARAQETKQLLDGLRNRIQFVLQLTTGFDNTDDPQLWEQQYNDYNGWRSPSQAKPTYSYSNQSFEAPYSAPITTNVNLNSPPPPTTFTHNYCFPAGTTVVTASGSALIEKLKLGDFVLSQNPESGELAYKPVQLTTLRPVTPLLKISLGAQSILATPGHPFWVVGKGWEVAKHLEVGMRLHGVNGAQTIDRIEESRPTEVYNLVVGDFHNYFVGDAQLLVHDNSPLEENRAMVPGLTPEK